MKHDIVLIECRDTFHVHCQCGWSKDGILTHRDMVLTFTRHKMESMVSEGSVGEEVPVIVMPLDVDKIRESVRRLLHYSWRDIYFEYEGLTPQEKNCITEDDFNMLVPWVQVPWE